MSEKHPPLKRPAISVRETARLEEDRLANLLMEKLIVSPEEAELGKPKPEDEAGPMPFLQRLSRRGLITTGQAQRLRQSLNTLLAQGVPGYELIERIGQGSTAQVFKARQAGPDRLVALKVMTQRGGHDADKFLALARAWARLRHPRLVQVLDAGCSPFPFCALEYLPFPSLDRDPRILPPAGPLNERNLTRIGLHASEALAYLHKKKIIHRDIKPANLFRLDDGSLLVGDLGLAIWSDVDPHRAREQRLALGTPYYMPPEQISNEPPLDGRADLYALGATLFHLATGRVPYPGENPDVVHRQHQEAPVPRLAALRPDLSAPFCDIVATLMSKEPKNRPMDAQTVVDLLSRHEARLLVMPASAKAR